MSVTVSNDKYTVTVSDERYQQILDDVKYEPNVKEGRTSPETVARGRILSDGGACFSHRNELSRLRYILTHISCYMDWEERTSELSWHRITDLQPTDIRIDKNNELVEFDYIRWLRTNDIEQFINRERERYGIKITRHVNEDCVSWEYGTHDYDKPNEGGSDDYDEN